MIRNGWWKKVEDPLHFPLHLNGYPKNKTGIMNRGKCEMKSHLSEYTPCRSCLFYVKSTDRCCPNCGVQNPGGALPTSLRAAVPRIFLTTLLSTTGGLGFSLLLQAWLGSFGLFAGLLLGLSSGLLWVPQQEKPKRNENEVRDSAYIASSVIIGSLATATVLLLREQRTESGTIIAGLFIGAFWGSMAGLAAVVLDRWVGSSFRQFLSRFSRKPLIHTLQSQEQTAEARVAQIRQRRRQIDSSLQQVEAQGDAERWRHLSENLQRARTILQEQLECCQLELMQIVLIRWYNRLQPLQSEWGHLDFTGCEHRLDELRQTSQLGRDHLEHWRRLHLETSTGQQRLKHLIEQLQKGLESCRVLEQALIERKAILALQGTLPVSIAETNAAELLHTQSGLFHASVQALAEFGEMYHQLETEYDLLMSQGGLTQH